MQLVLRMESKLLATMTRPKAVAITATLGVVLAGWAMLALMVFDLAGRGALASAGPGMALFDPGRLPETLLAFGRDAVAVLCGSAGIAIAAGGENFVVGPTVIALTFMMWAAMTAAMMVPSAAPLFTTYGDIAGAARERGKPVVSPLVLMAGYMTAWLGFCVLAAMAQIALTRAGLLTPGIQIASPYIAAMVLAGAALYQLSPAKAACLTKCRSPFAYLFTNWSDRPSGVFVLGLRQGGLCIGCCWALMLVMFTAGLMNVVWMALLAIIMTLEKIVDRPQTVVRVSAAGLLLWGGALATRLLQ